MSRGVGQSIPRTVPPEADVEAYLGYLAHQKRASPNTVSGYRRDLCVLQQLARRVRPQGADPALISWQREDVRRALSQLHAEGLSGRTLARHLSAWRGFYGWLGAQGRVLVNPCLGIRPPKSPRHLPKVLSVDEAARLLDTDVEGDPWVVARDQAMFELFYSSGLRVSELASLDCACLAMALEAGELRVMGKRRQERIVPVGRKAQEALRAWSLVRSERLVSANPDAHEALFLGWRGARIGVRSIRQRLWKHAVSAGILQSVHPHMLRHSFASHLLQSSGDLRAVQEMLGHRSIASTQVYTHLDFQHLALVYDKAHPRSRK